MNAVLEQIYATILPSAPYVIAAYAFMWLALLAYTVFLAVRLSRAEAQMALLAAALDRRETNKTADILKKQED
ncbi:hypothetical protein Ccur_05030 [Cryptobacterium curtum DSM 15641]|uniref:CcmD family protein n=1 Tax=Cryptobacterium curtum (strain ATCC 700683 / DSM 15641 / CCUG 43107 / 12-3) TaxID=469378 RepID=C7MMT4_CRYCD|nr:CcmD family protein [Cryptobacterium curtum]ACU94224.1 hypothetical protein Ccur_05030 [Cryptobacterium curtum DSM 15641]